MDHDLQGAAKEEKKRANVSARKLRAGVLKCSTAKPTAPASRAC
jgi:hypothetical protein